MIFYGEFTGILSIIIKSWEFLKQLQKLHFGLHSLTGKPKVQWLLHRYLDASCLIFGKDRQHLGTVDFSTRYGAEAVGGQAVTHSGDMMRPLLNEGRHTLDVDLDSLPPCVTELFVTLSAWGGMALGVRHMSFNCALLNVLVRASYCRD
jgi:stress response protein SCP2